MANSDSPVKRVRRKRYNWPPPVAPEDVYVPKQKNPIHSILTALPILMLVAGLYFHYQKESEQSDGAPIRAESVVLEGVFTGLSVVQSDSLGRHYLWVDVSGSTRGVRIKPSQIQQLQNLERGEVVIMNVAPTVTGSRTFWAWHIEQKGSVFLDVENSLQ